ncbi:HAD family hydrolase [Kibdelosporangium aridum]|uniref:Haloacid dehalogenase superfamily, subfamily IA, variant 1 with third motif having Dx(3-4)D or Dx(3-4)E n=1 Tax=Kibdelosporangium aridum TaxID=2030 RepID=A0A1Y5X2U0_KIBAR|nr:HAD family hydrolase [Kibdelosporangium aridum]SMC67018.1 haloacid dehalogenase superfamily, subfamily IA, variant 1 with third motif having Dx(3-4)D or Dx(3-4)E [Kibdelosporangium aridum]
MTDCLLFDVDGTLVDTNYLHTVAWHRAFLRFDLVVPSWRIHRAIGMGGDQLVPHLVGEKAEADLGDQVRQAWAEEYEPLIEFVHPFEGAHRLLSEAASVDIVVVLASSGPPEHVEHYIDLLDARDIAAAWTSSEDVSTTKPEPELLEVALGKVSADRAAVVGDSVWDCDAATRLGLPAVGTLTGGTCRAELVDHGAIAVYEHLDELRADLKDLAFVRLDAA